MAGPSNADPLAGWHRLVPGAVVLLILIQSLAFPAAFLALDRTESTGAWQERQLPPKVAMATAYILGGLVAAGLAGLGGWWMVRRDLVPGGTCLGVVASGLLLGLPVVAGIELGRWISRGMFLWMVAYTAPAGGLAVAALAMVVDRRLGQEGKVPGALWFASVSWGLAGVGYIVWPLPGTSGEALVFTVWPVAIGLVLGLVYHQILEGDRRGWPTVLTLPLGLWWAIHVTILVGLWIRMDALVASL